MKWHLGVGKKTLRASTCPVWPNLTSPVSELTNTETPKSGGPFAYQTFSEVSPGNTARTLWWKWLIPKHMSGKLEPWLYVEF